MNKKRNCGRPQMDKKDELELTIEALKSIRTRTYGGFGICRYFTEYTGGSRRVLRHYFESWDKFSGDIDYPVSSPINDDECSTATLAQVAYELGYDMWNKDKQYGSDRHELLEHCITEATRELTEFPITDK